jgi:hypothetical protein
MLALELDAAKAYWRSRGANRYIGSSGLIDVAVRTPALFSETVARGLLSADPRIGKKTLSIVLGILDNAKTPSPRTVVTIR